MNRADVDSLNNIYQAMGHEVCKSPFDELVMDAIGIIIADAEEHLVGPKDCTCQPWPAKTSPDCPWHKLFERRVASRMDETTVRRLCEDICRIGGIEYTTDLYAIVEKLKTAKVAEKPAETNEVSRLKPQKPKQAKPTCL